MSEYRKCPETEIRDAWCDSCDTRRPCRSLDLGRQGEVDLCRACWPKEMAFRKAINKDLDAKVRWPVFLFDEEAPSNEGRGAEKG